MLNGLWLILNKQCHLIWDATSNFLFPCHLIHAYSTIKAIINSEYLSYREHKLNSQERYIYNIIVLLLISELCMKQDMKK